MSLERTLKDWLREMKKLVIMGVGNPLRSDDKLGLAVVRQLHGRVGNQVRLIESETIPENYGSLIIDFEPTHILIVDAVQLKREPGFVRLLQPNEVTGISISTHNLPLTVIMRYLGKLTGANIALLGVQPKCLEFGEGLTKEIEDTVVRVAELLLRLLSS